MAKCDNEEELLRSVALQNAKSILAARQRAEDELVRAKETAYFLASASAALAELTDFESTFQKVAGLAVPFFADWCSVDMCTQDGSVRRLAITHTDSTKVGVAAELIARYPPRPSDLHGTMKVLRTGEPEWLAVISETLLAEFAQDQEHLRIIREIGLKSCICLPLKTRNRVLGALTFATAKSGRSYDIDDLRAAEDLADRAVIALENANLLAALKESDRRKDEFLAMLAHELRNPLAPIFHAVHMMALPNAQPGDLQAGRDIIQRQTQHLKRLVDDLLDVSRITRGKVELRLEPVELAAVIQRAVETSQPSINASRHQLSVILPPEPVQLLADLTRLVQVFGNLLNNAAKYMEPGGLIWLIAERSGHEVVVRVRDAGVGIHPEMLPKVFDLFIQINHSLDRAQGGLGIGLSLVQNLVQLHGGSVAAFSEGLGRGSEFVVRLPMTAEAPPDAANGLPLPSSTGPCLRILVVDDNVDAAKTLAMVLSCDGHDTVVASDGPRALHAARAHKPDVILLDLGLPGMDGFEVCSHLRQDAAFRNTMVVALTGYGQEEDRLKSLAAGFDAHVLKPMKLESLQVLFARAALRRSQVPR